MTLAVRTRPDPAAPAGALLERRSRHQRLSIRDGLPRAFATAVILLASGAFIALVLDGADSSRPEVLLLWLIAYAVAAAALLDGALRQRRPVPNPLSLLLLVDLAVLSVLWSAAEGLTVRRSVGLAGTVAVGLFIAQRLRPLDVLHAVRRAMLIIAVASLLLYASGSGLALDDVHGTLRGVLATKNTLGRNMALGVLACCGAVLIDRRELRRCALSAAPMLVTLALTDSTNGVLLAGLALVCTVAFSLSTSRAGKVLLTGTAALLLGGLVYVLPSTTAEAVAGAVGEDTTLTGRDVIWREAARAALDEALLGHGYGAFWEGTSAAVQIRSTAGWDVPHAHNGLLDVVLELGLVGGVLLLALLASLLVRAWRDAVEGHRDAAVLRFAVAGLTIISNLAESGVLVQNGLLLLLLVVAAALPSEPHLVSKSRAG